MKQTRRTPEKNKTDSVLIAGLIFFLLGLLNISFLGGFGLLMALLGIFLIAFSIPNGRKKLQEWTGISASAAAARKNPSVAFDERARAARGRATEMAHRFSARVTEEDKIETHDHIRSMVPEPQKQIEQWRTLRNAGIIDEKEFAERKKKILQGQGQEEER